MGDLNIGPKIYDSYYCKYRGMYNLFIVQEYMNGGDLNNWIYRYLMLLTNAFNP